MEHQRHLFYTRLSSNLVSLILVVVILIYGNTIIVPLLCAILLAILLSPLINIFIRKGLHPSLSILIPLSAAIVGLGGILFFLSSQVINFLDDIPTLRKRVSDLTSTCQLWVNENTHIAVTTQNQYLHQFIEKMKDQGPQFLEATFVSLKEIMTYLFLVPLYAFLILYYKETIKAFLVGIFNKNGSTQRVREVLNESASVAQHYVTGLIIETTLVFGLNLIGFSIVGIKYKVFLALLAALLSLLPYIGLLIGSLLCMLTTLVSSENIGDAIWVGVIIGLVHFFDSNIGMPLIVGNKIRINALAIVVGVLVGGTLCGVPGMFLAIPGLAVLKIIFDKAPGLKPWGILLGDETSATHLRKQEFNPGKEKIDIANP